MKVNGVPSVTHFRRAAGSGSSCVFRIRGGVIETYEARDLPNPDTSEQQLSRGAFRQSSAAWRALSAEEKLAWDRYARANVGWFVGRQTAEPLTGLRVFHAAAGNLQILGLPILSEAPSQPPPEGLHKLELLPTGELDTLRLRVEHGLPGDGYRVVVSMSPATLRPSRKADRRTGRHVCGWGAGSTASLPVSGGVVEFTGCRYSVEPGQRFGVWVRVVRESDGLGSVEMFLDVIRRKWNR